MKIELEMDTGVFDRACQRAAALGASVDDYIEQALVYAMAHEEQDHEEQVPVATEETNNEDV